MPRRKKKNTTPVRAALESTSTLLPSVQDGLGAVKGAHRSHFAVDVRTAFDDSLDLDEALQSVHPNDNRWDYLLGHKATSEVIGVEPHSAKQDEISTVIQKRAAAKQQLTKHLKEGKRVSAWLWVASGRVHFADTEKARRRLDQNGIQFVGNKVMAKHLK